MDISTGWQERAEKLEKEIHRLQEEIKHGKAAFNLQRHKTGAAEQQVRELRVDKAVKYMNHSYGCVMQNIDLKGKCVCGLDKALNKE